MMFETYRVPAIYFANPGVLSLYSVGRTTGVVCDSGDGVTQVIPICHGFKVNNGIRKIPKGGRNITNFLARLLLFERTFECDSSDKKEMIREIKERLCFVAQDYESDL